MDLPEVAPQRNPMLQPLRNQREGKHDTPRSSEQYVETHFQDVDPNIQLGNDCREMELDQHIDLIGHPGERKCQIEAQIALQ